MVVIGSPEKKDVGAGYKEINVPRQIEESSKKLSPFKIKRFVAHLSKAAVHCEEKITKKQELKDHIAKVRTVSLNKRSTKAEIENVLDNFESVVQKLVKDEEKILAEQRKETKEITDLKSMVESLSKRLVELSGSYSKDITAKDKKILELREALVSANIKISETGEKRQKKIAEIENKIKGSSSNSSVKKKSDDVGLDFLESTLQSLEQRHLELMRSGKHSKDVLKRIENKISEYKKKISQLKRSRKTN